MSRQKSARKGAQFAVIDIVVPTYQDGIVTRPTTVAYWRTNYYTIQLGMAICNVDNDQFSSEAGRDIAFGRLLKRPINVRSEARTVEGVEAAIRNAATVQNLWNSTRRSA